MDNIPSQGKNQFEPQYVVNSSSIAGYSYDPEQYILTVVFKKSPTPHQYLYVLPSTVSEVFDTPGSIGRKFHRMIVQAGYQHMVLK